MFAWNFSTLNVILHTLVFHEPHGFMKIQIRTHWFYIMIFRLPDGDPYFTCSLLKGQGPGRVGLPWWHPLSQLDTWRGQFSAQISYGWLKNWMGKNRATMILKFRRFCDQQISGGPTWTLLSLVDRPTLHSLFKLGVIDGGQCSLVVGVDDFI